VKRLLERVRQTIRDHDLAGPGTRVVIGLSGGSDSLALACLLRELNRTRELTVVGLAHFNHQLRAAADDEERFCAEFAASLGWAFLADRGDVAALAARERRSLEDAAHGARHAFLEQARLHFGADVVARGHTRDDQAETFLLRLLRGAGSRGLAAMHPRHGCIVRPVLACRRADLRALLTARGIAFVHDTSNEDVGIPRNRVRAELLPLLEGRFNPAIVEVLADEAELAREEWSVIAAEASAASARVCRREGDIWRLDAASLNALPRGIARVVVREAMTGAAGNRPVAFTHVEGALGLSRWGGGPVDGPGQRVQRIGPDLVLTPRAAHEARGGSGQARANNFRFPLSIPGEAVAADRGWRVSVEVFPAGAGLQRAATRNGTTAAVQLGPSSGPLAVRNRRPGDWFRPLGLGGRKKLQDFFVDRKIPRAQRDQVPLVVDESDRIVWVAGLAIDHDFRVTDPAQAVLILRLNAVGGSA
jgi:tRNA(Ile)-lysidine synthase